MTSEARHRDVAAYVLGVLDVGDAERFEVHLAACDGCAGGVAALLPVTSLLPTADVGDLAPARPSGSRATAAAACWRRRIPSPACARA